MILYFIHITSWLYENKIILWNENENGKTSRTKIKIKENEKWKDFKYGKLSK